MTRKEYLDKTTGSPDPHVLHRAYYAQFVTATVKARVRAAFSYERLAEAVAASPHMNSIPLEQWDRIAVPIPADVAAKLRALGDYPTLALAVCWLKEAAQQIVEQGQ